MIDDVEPEWDDAVDEFDEDAQADTLPCPDCGEEVYDDTDRCPHCGQWIMPLAAVSSRPSRALTWVVIVMIVLMVILAIA